MTLQHARKTLAGLLLNVEIDSKVAKSRAEHLNWAHKLRRMSRHNVTLHNGGK